MFSTAHETYYQRELCYSLSSRLAVDFSRCAIAVLMLPSRAAFSIRSPRGGKVRSSAFRCLHWRGLVVRDDLRQMSRLSPFIPISMFEDVDDAREFCICAIAAPARAGRRRARTRQRAVHEVTDRKDIYYTKTVVCRGARAELGRVGL